MTRNKHLTDNEGNSPTTRIYRPSDKQSFVELNLEWIEESFAVEASDREQLEQLEAAILDRGGQIVVAESDDRVVGVGAIRPLQTSPADGHKWLEIIKMATDKGRRRQGIGLAVLQRLIAEAKMLQADRIWLETNSVLQPAVCLYESVGFLHLSPEDFWPTPYQRCNVQMVLEL